MAHRNEALCLRRSSCGGSTACCKAMDRGARLSVVAVAVCWKSVSDVEDTMRARRYETLQATQ